MPTPFVGEIRIFPFNFAPQGWAFCNGQLLPIAQNTALFSLLGTTYGGNGQNNFALPDYRNRSSIQQGQGPGLSPYVLGEFGGSADVTLSITEIPAHTHIAKAKTTGGSANAAANIWGTSGTRRPTPNFYSTITPDVSMNPGALGISGGGLPHNNLIPYLGINFCIALQGIFPTRP